MSPQRNPRPTPRAGVILILLPAVLALSTAGCGGRPGADASRAEATVSGVVKLRGKPVVAGKVTFYPSNIDRETGGSSATIGPDGTYSARTLVGVNAVTFAGDLFGGDRTLQVRKRTVTLDPGANTRNFDLGSESDEGQGPRYPTGKKGPRR